MTANQARRKEELYPTRPADPPDPWWDDLKAKWKAGIQPYVAKRQKPKRDATDRGYDLAMAGAEAAQVARKATYKRRATNGA